MAKSKKLCLNYCLILSTGGTLLLVSFSQLYLSFLCYYDVEELKVSKRTDYTYSILIAAGIYFAIIILCVVLQAGWKSKIDPEGYQRLAG
jgi:hypothetical protein